MELVPFNWVIVTFPFATVQVIWSVENVPLDNVTVSSAAHTEFVLMVSNISKENKKNNFFIYLIF